MEPMVKMMEKWKEALWIWMRERKTVAKMRYYICEHGQMYGSAGNLHHQQSGQTKLLHKYSLNHVFVQACLFFICHYLKHHMI
jgi:hypothetical protein